MVYDQGLKADRIMVWQGRKPEEGKGLLGFFTRALLQGVTETLPENDLSTLNDLEAWASIFRHQQIRTDLKC